MRKGKGGESSRGARCRNVFIAGRPVTMTRLTRTMGFVEVPHAPCASGSIDAGGDEDPFEDLLGSAH
jgi:hypothetical protein